MKVQKIRDLDDNEINQQLRDIEEQMFRLRFQMSMGQMDGLKKVRAMKKDRARMLTILHERQAQSRALQSRDREGAEVEQKG